MISVKNQRVLVGALWLTLGTGLTRVMPVFIGMVFARMHTPQAYADFLAFIVGANLIAAIPLMGATQLILSASVELGHVSLLRQSFKPLLVMQGISSLCLVIFTAISSGHAGKTINIDAISLYIYSLGYCVTGMMAATFNRIGLQVHAGKCWVLAIIISTISCFVAFLLNVSVNATLFYLAVGWLVSGLLCTWKGWVVLQRRDIDIVGRDAAREPDSIDIRNVLIFGLPSVTFLFGFYWLINQVQSAGDSIRAGAFSLGYQLFSVGLFLPGVLGNIITPRLNEAKNDLINLRKLLRYSFLCYVLIAFMIGVLVYASLPWLLVAFNIPDGQGVRSLVLIFQLAVIIAAPQALLNQWMASERLSLHILVSALVWLILLISIQISDGTNTMPAWGLVLAYVGSFLYGATVLFRRVYGKTANDPTR